MIAETLRKEFGKFQWPDCQAVIRASFLVCVITLVTPVTSRCGDSHSRAASAMHEKFVSVRRFVIPWGTANGCLEQRVGEKGAELFKGPSSIRFDERGRLYVLDALRPGVECFDRNGRCLWSVELPANDEKGRSFTYPDIATGGGSIYVLESRVGLVLSYTPGVDSPGITVIPIAQGEQRDLTTIDRLGDGSFVVHDSISGEDTHFSADGLIIDAVPDVVCAQSAIDSSGDRYFIRAATSDSARKFVLVRQKSAGSSEIIRKMKCGPEVTSYAVHFVDKRGRIYVEIASGAMDLAVRHRLYVFSQAGELLKKLDLPSPPSKLAMTRCRAFCDDGTLAVLRTARKGLVVYLARTDD